MSSLLLPTERTFTVSEFDKNGMDIHYTPPYLYMIRAVCNFFGIYL